MRAIYAATYPWSLPFRFLTFASVTFAVIGGGGWLLCSRVAGRGYSRGWAASPRGGVCTGPGTALVVTWLLLSTWAMIVLMEVSRAERASFSSDDAVAMAWLRANAEPDGVVVNDTFADAGIWAPYKAGRADSDVPQCE